MSAVAADAPTPFEVAGQLLLRTGWHPIPLPAGAKTPPPVGFTGRNAAVASRSDIGAWIADGVVTPSGSRPAVNVGTHVPERVVGLDVDAYGTKRGADTMRALTAELGRLPRTVQTSRRFADGDLASGIRWFRLPEHVELVGNLEVAQPDGVITRDCEVIQAHHRYAVLPPSVVDGAEYELLVQDGGVRLRGADAIHAMSIAGLPMLPTAWIERLLAERQGGDAIDPNATPVQLTPGQPSLEVSRLVDGVLKELRAGSRHDAMAKLVMALTRLAEQGHPGTAVAMDRCRTAFLAAVSDSRAGAAPGEWQRMVEGAALKVASSPTVPEGLDFAAILREAGLNVPLTLVPPPPVSQEPPALAAPQGPAQPAYEAPLALVAPTAVGPEESPEDLMAGLVAATRALAPERPRSSWAPVDLDALLDGDLRLPEPEVWEIEPGRHMLYRGKIQTIIGAPGGWKSYATMLAVVSVLAAGQRALVIDAEEEPAVLLGRLLELGATPEQLRRGDLAVINPKVDFGDPSALEDVGRVLLEHWDIVIMDSFTRVSMHSGVDGNDSKDVSRWIEMVPETLAKSPGRPAVLIVDHMSKTAEAGSAYATGSHAKLAVPVLTFSVKPGSPRPSRYKPEWEGSGIGSVLLVIAKDRFGNVGPTGGGYRVTVDSRGDFLPRYPQLRKITVSVAYEPPTVEMSAEDKAERMEQERAAAADRQRSKRMQQAVAALQQLGGHAPSRRAFEAVMGGKKDGDNGCMSIAGELQRRGVFAITTSPSGTTIDFAPEWRSAAVALGVAAPEIAPELAALANTAFDPASDIAPAGPIPTGDIGDSPFSDPTPQGKP